MLFQFPFPNMFQNATVFSRLQMLRRDGRATIPIAASNDFTTLATFKMPPSSKGYLVGYQNEVLDPTYDYGGSLLWDMQVNGSGFDAEGLSFFSELRGTRIAPANALNFIGPGQAVTLRVRRQIASAASTVATGSVILVLWPQVIETTWLHQRANLLKDNS